MAAIRTNERDAIDEEPASSRVESFLDCVETRRQRTIRVRMAAAGVGAAVAAVVYLTSIGIVPPDAGRLAASAGTLVAGILVGDP